MRQKHGGIWSDVDAETTTNPYTPTVHSYFFEYSSTRITEHHLGTSEKLDFIGSLVLYRHVRFVNLNPLTYIIILPF